MGQVNLCVETINISCGGGGGNVAGGAGGGFRSHRCRGLLTYVTPYETVPIRVVYCHHN